ncbi:hypothetical protein RRF57_003267 [Xylaria bambusicola]|uniref:Gfd2/YDR514C-like C-terminal domain-containing protein n=1 Tax=Xylaria bambusicola TaxID=326684 RepID=A0AAN7UGA9_9PEZI
MLRFGRKLSFSWSSFPRPLKSSEGVILHDPVVKSTVLLSIKALSSRQLRNYCRRVAVEQSAADAIAPVSTKAQLNNLPPTKSKGGLQIVQEALGLSNATYPSLWSRSLLLSIDFEHLDNIRSGFTKGGNCQVGIATLDTSNLQKDLLPPPNNLIETYNYVSGSNQYIKKVIPKFIFGESLVVNSASILKMIELIIPQHQNRRIIIVSHGIQNELMALHALGYRFSANMHAVCSHRLAVETLGLQCALGKLLRWVGCPYHSLHIGGNDAHFTLKACLLLALHNNHDTEDTTSLAGYLKGVATSDVPHQSQPEVQTGRRG